MCVCQYKEYIYRITYVCFLKGNIMYNDKSKEFLEELIIELVKNCNDIELLDLIVLLLRR